MQYYISIDKKTTMTKLQDYKLTLHRIHSDEVAMMALRATDDKAAINKAHRCMGQDWFVVTLEA